LEEGGEISVLDAERIPLDSEEIEQLVKNVNSMVAGNDPSHS